VPKPAIHLSPEDQEIYDSLKEAARTYHATEWTPQQISFLKEFWGKVRITTLHRKLRHEPETIRIKGKELGLPDLYKQKQPRYFNKAGQVQVNP
jgi:hypothetical protein